MLLQAKKQKSIVGLDIEGGSAAAAEVRANGAVELVRHGVVSLDPGAFREGEVGDPEALGESLKELFAANKLSRNVRLGIANQRVAVRVLRLPDLEGDELEAAIRFQAQDSIPMPLEQAVLDWQVVSRSEGEDGPRHVDVVAVAARRDMLTAVLDALHRAGLRPVGIDHSAFGMIRALKDGGHTAVGAAGYVSAPNAADPVGGEGASIAAGGLDDPAATAAGGIAETASMPPPARLYCNLADVTNLAVAHDGACLFTRVSPFGLEAITQRLAERREMTLEHARHWLGRVGLEPEVEAIDGDPELVRAAREVLTEGAAKLADELRMSLDFYAAQDASVPVDGIVACGPGTTIPGLAERLQEGIGRPFEIARPAALGALDDTLAARLTLPFGIALED